MDEARVREASMILVVDDDDDVRRTIVHSLGVLAYDTVEAPDGATALSLVREHHPDLVILDYLMPGMNGLELAEEIRKIEPEVPVIFASGYAEVAELRLQARRGLPVLHKPFRLGELAELIDAAL